MPVTEGGPGLEQVRGWRESRFTNLDESLWAVPVGYARAAEYSMKQCRQGAGSES